MRLNPLSQVYIFKIGATVLFWSIPLLVLPRNVFLTVGLIQSVETNETMFLRLLGWAYLALCVGYSLGLMESLNGGKVVDGPIYVGLVSNGGACVMLGCYGISGAWSQYHGFVQFVGWSSVVATFFITLGLYLFGYKNLSRGAPSSPMKVGAGSRLVN